MPQYKWVDQSVEGLTDKYIFHALKGGLMFLGMALGPGNNIG